MAEEELKNKCKERAKIFQQAMESCKSSSPMDCIEWFADRIAELKKENAELKESNKMLEQGYVWHNYDAGEDCYEDSHEGKWVKRDEIYQLTKAKEIIKELVRVEYADFTNGDYSNELSKVLEQAEQFIKDSEVEK